MAGGNSLAIIADKKTGKTYKKEMDKIEAEVLKETKLTTLPPVTDTIEAPVLFLL